VAASVIQHHGDVEVQTAFVQPHPETVETVAQDVGDIPSGSLVLFADPYPDVTGGGVVPRMEDVDAVDGVEVLDRIHELTGEIVEGSRGPSAG
jgi:hypothetical protein